MEKQTQNNFGLQPIFLSKDQYQELLKAISMYALVKQASPVPAIASEEFGDYIMGQGNKFGFEKAKTNDMDWFEKVNEEVFEALFHYSQHEAWEHLANRLAHRDAKIATGASGNILDKEMQSDLFLDIMGKRLEIYLDEFSKNGIKNVVMNLK